MLDTHTHTHTHTHCDCMVRFSQLPERLAVSRSCLLDASCLDPVFLKKNEAWDPKEKCSHFHWMCENSVMEQFFSGILKGFNICLKTFFPPRLSLHKEDHDPGFNLLCCVRATKWITHFPSRKRTNVRWLRYCKYFLCENIWRSNSPTIDWSPSLCCWTSDWNENNTQLKFCAE